MKIIFDETFHEVYSSDPASAEGRLESVLAGLPTNANFISPDPATPSEIELAHTFEHIDDIKNQGVYEISALAAGGAILAARVGLKEPCFGLIRPPGHHASSDSSWGFCYFNNMAIALLTLRSEDLIDTALVLDIDLHYGDGTSNILQGNRWVSVVNPERNTRKEYLNEVENTLSGTNVDLIGISAGFDNHKEDWGGLMATEDYYTIGRMVKDASENCSAGYFAILEGGYNHRVLGQNVTALINGMS